MIRGFFSPTHLGSVDPAATEVPLLDAFLYVPCVDAHVTLQLLVDTGADMTVLHAQDSLRLLPTDEKWEIVRRHKPEDFGGAGAGRPYYPVPAVIILSHDDGTTDSLTLPIWIAELGGPNDAHESLFGRDLLSHYTLTFEQAAELTLERR